MAFAAHLTQVTQSTRLPSWYFVKPVAIFDVIIDPSVFSHACTEKRFCLNGNRTLWAIDATLLSLTCWIAGSLVGSDDVECQAFQFEQNLLVCPSGVMTKHLLKRCHPHTTLIPCTNSSCGGLVANRLVLFRSFPSFHNSCAAKKIPNTTINWNGLIPVIELLPVSSASHYSLSTQLCDKILSKIMLIPSPQITHGSGAKTRTTQSMMMKTTKCEVSVSVGDKTEIIMFWTVGIEIQKQRVFLRKPTSQIFMPFLKHKKNKATRRGCTNSKLVVFEAFEKFGPSLFSVSNNLCLCHSLHYVCLEKDRKLGISCSFHVLLCSCDFLLQTGCSQILCWRWKCFDLCVSDSLACRLLLLSTSAHQHP